MPKLILRLITIITWVISVLWFVQTPSYEPFLAFLTGLTTLLTSFFIKDSNLPSFDYQNYYLRNRKAMLGLVKNCWGIDEIDNSSLDLIKIDLQLREDKSLITRPFESYVEKNNSEQAAIPCSLILNVFENTGRSLLILGEPGSGKTTLLRRLVTEQIIIAERNNTSQIPVIFHLSTWNYKKNNLLVWIVDELQARYKVSKSISRSWLEDQSLMIFLDGLDEVEANQREACINSINSFLQENGLVPIAICCRSREYIKSNTRLNLNYAVEILPLNETQIDNELKRLGRKTSPIRKILNQDPRYKELITSPLMFQIMVTTFQNEPPNKPISSTRKICSDDKRKELFDNYVETMLQRRQYNMKYSPTKIIFWLGQLAKQMQEQDIPIFALDSIQPNWLKNNKEKMYYALISRGISGFLCGSIGIGIFWLLVICPFFLNVSLEATEYGASVVFDVILLFFILFGLIIAFSALGILGGLLIGAIRYKRIRQETIVYVNSVHWSLGMVIDEAKNRIHSWALQIRNPGLLNDVPIAYYRLIHRLVGSLPSGFYSTVSSENANLKNRLNLSVKCGFIAAIMGFVYGSIYIMIFWFLFTVSTLVEMVMANTNELYLWFVSAILLGIVPGIVTGIVGFFRYGGFAIIQNKALRLTLASSSTYPRKFSAFLDYATDLGFLKRVGEGYMFIHELIQQHFLYRINT